MDHSIEAKLAASPLDGRAVAVAGGAGFVGARLVEKLAAHGARVTVLTRSKRVDDRRLPNVRVVEVDFSDPESLAAAVSRHSVVFNVIYDWTGSEAANAKVFSDLLKASEAAGPTTRFVHVSSIAVYDEWPKADLTESSPITTQLPGYKRAKMAQEEALLERFRTGAIAPVIVQPTLIYGPYSRWWTDAVVERLIGGGIQIPGDGMGACNVVFVDDVADAMIAAAHRDEALGERFIISGAEPASWRDYFSMYEDILGRSSAVYPADPPATANDQSSLIESLKTRMPPGITRKLGGLSRKLRRVLSPAGSVARLPDAGERELYMNKGRCRIDKARRLLGYEPTFTLTTAKAPMERYLRARFASYFATAPQDAASFRASA